MLSVKKYIIRREKRISREKIAQILEETDIPSGSDISGISDNGDRDQEWLPVRPEVNSSSDDEEFCPLLPEGRKGRLKVNLLMKILISTASQTQQLNPLLVLHPSRDGFLDRGFWTYYAKTEL
jgi:hypothetical protein